MANLDGKDVIQPTPFDAHEQIVRKSPEQKEPLEFPKAVDHVDHPSGVGQEPIVVKSAEEGDAYHEAKTAAAEEQK